MTDDPREDPLGINNMDYDDPIVAEVHAARDKLFAEAGFDIDELIRRSRALQALYGQRVVDLSRKPAGGER